jgi:hypothetical protein
MDWEDLKRRVRELKMMASEEGEDWMEEGEEDWDMEEDWEEEDWEEEEW